MEKETVTVFKPRSNGQTQTSGMTVGVILTKCEQCLKNKLCRNEYAKRTYILTGCKDFTFRWFQ